MLSSLRLTNRHQLRHKSAYPKFFSIQMMTRLVSSEIHRKCCVNILAAVDLLRLAKAGKKKFQRELLGVSV